MSLGVIITEAGAKSGALLTAMYALDQNREVFAVPGPVTSGTSAGTNKLIKQGAKLVESVEDILSEIRNEIGLKMDNTPKPEPDLKGIPAKIYKLLNNEPVHIDQVALMAEISVSEALTNLLTLELLGHVKQMAGKMFIRS